ncbi:hypothetical protein [Sinomicrobium sp. M5D2P9]
MKVVSLLICVFLVTGLNAQIRPSRIFLKSGEELIAKGKIKGDHYRYKLYSKGKRIDTHFDDIDHIDVFVTKDSIVTYRGIKVKTSVKPEIVREVRTGEVNLYIASAGGSTSMPMSSGGFGGFSVPVTYTIENYYLRRKGEEEATHLGSNQLFTKNFMEAASDYFKDCPLLVEKIENKEYKKRHLEEVVTFYNTRCN